MKPTPGPWELDDDEQVIDGIGPVHMHRVVASNGDVCGPVIVTPSPQ